MLAKKVARSRTENLVAPVSVAILKAVEAGSPLTSTDLAATVNSHRQRSALHRALGTIQEQYQKTGWLDLSAAVVGGRSGVPGFGRLNRRETRDAWIREWHAVQAFEWAADFPAIVPGNGRASGGW